MGEQLGLPTRYDQLARSDLVMSQIYVLLSIEWRFKLAADANNDLDLTVLVRLFNLSALIESKLNSSRKFRIALTQCLI